MKDLMVKYIIKQEINKKRVNMSCKGLHHFFKYFQSFYIYYNYQIHGLLDIKNLYIFAALLFRQLYTLNIIKYMYY